jgi:hypothetical protein
VPDLDEEPERCEACGSTAFRPATRRERLQAWFAYGRGGGGAWYCTGCGASWSAGSSYVLLRAPSGLARRLRLPWDVFEALRAARHWHPVPRFYAIVGLVALVPAALVAVVGRSRREAGRFGLLAPVGWDGELTVEGRSWSVPPRGRRELTEAAVVADHGDPALDPEELEDLHRAEARRRFLAAVRAHDRDHDRRVRELASSWRTGTVRVDGEAVPARLLTDGDAAVATCRLGDGGAVLIVAVGVAVDGLALARVTDPGPLLTERAIRQRRLLLGEGVTA